MSRRETDRDRFWTVVGWGLVILLALMLLCAALGCYTGNPPWPYDPTQPAGPFPRRNYEVLPVSDGGTDLAMPPLPEKPPRENTWCSR